MTTYHYRLLNVFALDGQPLSGNPLCVFEDARGLDAPTMQALALQFNLSETTFILPSDTATAQVRIFTPEFEMPFAGHPTLGTAQVVRDLFNTSDAITLQMQAGIIPVTAQNNFWTLKANAPSTRAVTATVEQLAQMLELQPQDIGASPLWVNTGSDQLIVPLTSVAAVQRCNPQLHVLKQYAAINAQRCLVYLWSPRDADNIESRFFFAKGGSLAEDPATGSACANLGGWFIATQTALPLSKRIHQGALVQRPSLLNLHVDAQQHIHVSGRVLELGRGIIDL
jgi:trans-2,3-dihydro-3-hydroxyanthranilate isomerase